MASVAVASRVYVFIAFPGSSTLQRARMEAALWGARARAKWFELGLALNLSEETLEVICRLTLSYVYYIASYESAPPINFC